jgi:hypothetical protein
MTGCHVLLCNIYGLLATFGDAAVNRNQEVS